ncbi:MAG: hypothetical protein HOD64_10230, partial [Candidatus Cloacimonetes bacterium]|nr:hypothetical protein [Candidatus Cloacimonadota bacterium]
QIYRTILSTFSTGKDYSDEWVEKTYDRLVELGIEKPKIHEHYYTNYGWKSNRSPIVDLASTQYNYGIWKNVNITNEQVAFDSAYIVTVNDTFATYIKKDFEAQITPELLNIKYAYSHPLDIYINDVLLEKEAEIKEELAHVGDELLPEYNISTSTNLTSGTNTIVFKIPQSEDSEKVALFSAMFSVQFDKGNLEYQSTTEEYALFSDYTWMTQKDGFVPEEITYTDTVEVSVVDTLNSAEAAVDSTETSSYGEGWIAANSANFKFFKAQMYGMEESEAVDIWYPVIDSNNVETVNFRKDFEISGDVSDATLKCIGQNSMTIWINGVLLVEDRGIVIDDRLKKIQPFESIVSGLVPGMNTIEIEVRGGREFKGLIFEMHYRAKKKLTE